MKFLRLFFGFFCLAFFVGQAQSKSLQEEKILIQGDEKALDVSDLPMPTSREEHLNSFMDNWDPEKDLLSLLEKPDVLLNLNDTMVALDFDDPWVPEK